MPLAVQVAPTQCVYGSCPRQEATAVVVVGAAVVVVDDSMQVPLVHVPGLPLDTMHAVPSVTNVPKRSRL